MRHFLQTPFGAHFSSFENFGFMSDYYHGVAEGNAGIGFGVCVLVLISMFELFKQRQPARPIDHNPFLRLLRLAPWGVLLVFMAKVGTFENARQMAPYYAFLFPVFLIKAGHSNLVRRRDWQRLGLLMMTITGILLATLSERPLFPAKTIYRALHAKFPGCELVSDEYFRYLESNYQVRQARRDYLEAALPPDETAIGYYAGMLDVDEPGIWLPRPQRRVEDITSGDSPEQLRSLGIHYVVVDGAAVLHQNGSITNWMNKYDAGLVGEYVFPRTSFQSPPPPPDFYLTRLN
jgi:hypothetical protein